MPIYEYECAKCLHHFDLMQKINDQPIKQCPECQEDKVIRLVSAAGFQLKGSGWYVTDFKNKDSSPKKEKDVKESTGTKENPSAQKTESGKNSDLKNNVVNKGEKD